MFWGLWAFFLYNACLKPQFFTSHHIMIQTTREMSEPHDPRLILLFSFLYLRLHIDWLDHSSLAMLCKKMDGRVGGNQTLLVVDAPPTQPGPPGAQRCDYSSLTWCVYRGWEGHWSLLCSNVGGALKHTGRRGQHTHPCCSPSVLCEEYWMQSLTLGSWQCIITWTWRQKCVFGCSGTLHWQGYLED